MTTTTLDSPAPSHGSAGWKVVPGLALVAAAFYLMVEQTAFRSVEARLTAHLMSVVTTGRSASTGDIVYFGIGSPDIHGIVITTLCSTVVLAAPLLALGGVLLLVPALRPARVVTGLVVALALAAACNLARYAAAGWALQRWGLSGFNLVHEYLGSLVVIAGFALSIFLLLRICVGRRTGKHV